MRTGESYRSQEEEQADNLLAAKEERQQRKRGTVGRRTMPSSQRHKCQWIHGLPCDSGCTTDMISRTPTAFTGLRCKLPSTGLRKRMRKCVFLIRRWHHRRYQERADGLLSRRLRPRVGRQGKVAYRWIERTRDAESLGRCYQAQKNAYDQQKAAELAELIARQEAHLASTGSAAGRALRRK